MAWLLQLIEDWTQTQQIAQDVRTNVFTEERFKRVFADGDLDGDSADGASSSGANATLTHKEQQWRQFNSMHIELLDKTLGNAQGTSGTEADALPLAILYRKVVHQLIYWNKQVRISPHSRHLPTVTNPLRRKTYDVRCRM